MTRPLELTALFDACFRIQREAYKAAGRHIPLIVENVRGAQPWVGGVEEKRLYEKEMSQWKEVGKAEGRFRKLAQRIVRGAA